MAGEIDDFLGLDSEGRKSHFEQMIDSVNSGEQAVPPARSAEFGKLVFNETLRRALRKTPQERLEMLCASLRDAEQRGMIPKRDRAAHERKLLWLIQHASSRH